MAALKGVLVDLDGVVYVGGTAVPGAVEAIHRLRAAGLGVRFLTNTTRTPHGRLLGKLNAMGLDVAAAELVTPARAARRMMEKDGLSPHLIVHPDLLEDFAGLATGGTRPAVVLGDAGDSFSYAALNAAFRLLDDGAAFLALANNRYFREEDGALSLDAGPFVAALRFASGREPVVLGKPAPAFFLSALASLGCAPEDAAMIGDDVESDVGGAMAIGCAGLLVRTGKYRPGAETRIDPRPTAVVDDLPAAAEWLLSRAAAR